MINNVGPERLVVAFYADDFTGSTDAMEAMTAAGLETVLFLDVPSHDLLARFPSARCVGIAGSSRARNPEWMDAELPRFFGAMAGMRPAILHYKICSTFDSSPAIGSIGRAIDLGTKVMPGRWSPAIVGSPSLARYQVFGNLFAGVEGAAHRLDRHPTMSRHPITPMREADLRRHLELQTARRIELIDMVQLKQGTARQRLEKLTGVDVPIVLIDVLDAETLAAAGGLVWEERGAGVFSASSSGLPYALGAYWKQAGMLPSQPALPRAAPISPIFAVSGSCSPLTALQIAWARANGFRTERLDLAMSLDANSREVEIDRLACLSNRALEQGVSVVIFSAEGPDDATVVSFDRLAADAGISRSDAERSIGAVLGEVTKRVLDRGMPSRVVVAGGDSSGEIVGALGIQALTIAASLCPGAPLCRAWSRCPNRNGLELVLKGGQIGDEKFFGKVRSGQ